MDCDSNSHGSSEQKIVPPYNDAQALIFIPKKMQFGTFVSKKKFILFAAFYNLYSSENLAKRYSYTIHIYYEQDVVFDHWLFKVKLIN